MYCNDCTLVLMILYQETYVHSHDGTMKVFPFRTAPKPKPE